GIGRLHGVHGERPDRVDDELIQARLFSGGGALDGTTHKASLQGADGDAPAGALSMLSTRGVADSAPAGMLTGVGGHRMSSASRSIVLLAVAVVLVIAAVVVSYRSSV